MRKLMTLLARIVPFILLASTASCEGEEQSSGPWGGGGSGNSGQGAGFNKNVCALLAPCCVQAGLKSDPATCAQMIGANTSSQTFDAAAAQACEDAIRTASSNGTVCALSTLNTEPSCDGVYKDTGGTRQPGETCDEDGDCALQPTGKVKCLYGYDQNQSKIQTCGNVFDGKVGDSPCVGYRTDEYTVYTSTSGTPPKVGYICDQTQGMTCDSESKACKMLAKAGETCSWSQDCVSTAWCNPEDHVCQAKAGVGASCSLSESQCDDTLTYCNAAKVCTALIENGQPCETSGQCKSGDCTNAKCKATTDLSLIFICQQ